MVVFYTGKVRRNQSGSQKKPKWQPEETKVAARSGKSKKDRQHNG